jgi:succinyl-diaminopimelate desuccinylase
MPRAMPNGLFLRGFCRRRERERGDERDEQHIHGLANHRWNPPVAVRYTIMTRGIDSALVAAIDADRDAMRDLLAALVALPTENPPATQYRPCVELLQAALCDLGFEPEAIHIPSPVDAPRTAVRAWLGDSGPALCFHGHYDVVPAASASQFVPRIEGDTLFGRGSSDMKSGLVAMLYAARALRSTDVRLAGRIVLLCVPDEETGGAFGSAALSAAGQLAAPGDHVVGMLLPEPTSGVVWHANHGALTLEATVPGRAAHVALSHQGVNAFERALPLFNRLAALARDVERRGSVLLVGGRVEAGSNFNVVPAECRFTVDRRVSPDEDFESEKHRLLALFDEARADGVDVSIRVIQEGRAASTSPTHALGRALAESAAAITHKPPAFETCPGLLETRFYAQRGIPAYAYGPGILAVSHGPQEFVKITRMVECAKIYALTAASLLGAGSDRPAG